MAFRGKSVVGRIISSVPYNPYLASPKSRCPSAPAGVTTHHSSVLSDILPSESHRASPVPGGSVLRRFLHQLGARACGRNHPFALPLQGRLGLPTGESLVEKLRGLGGKRAPILDALARPPIPPDIEDEPVGVSAPVSTRLSREVVKERLRAIPDDSISYADFLRICREESGGEDEDATAVARALDDSGAVIIIGSLVFVRPEQVVQAIEKAMAPHYPKQLKKHIGNDTTATDIPTSSTRPTVAEHHYPKPPSSSELRELDAQLAQIDTKAAAGARRELWAGLLLLMAQTVGFARLTFWELSWDVMEPVCFYVTSLYFMAGYAFFLRTDKDPSFEGVFQARFLARRRRLIRDTGFRIHRYEELLRSQAPWGNSISTAAGTAATTLPPSTAAIRSCGAWSRAPPRHEYSSSPSCCDCRRRLV